MKFYPYKKKGGGGGKRVSAMLKGNLAHKFMIFYFVCLSFHFDISNTLKTKNIENTG